jgi:hypothetical protein
MPMPAFRCPRCDTAIQVEEADWGYEVECPVCRAIFTPGADRPAPRTRRHFQDEDEEDEYDRPSRRRRAVAPEELIEEARRIVFLPALCSSIACILAILLHTLGLVLILVNPQMLKNNPFLPKGGMAPPPEIMLGIKAFMILYGLVALAGTFSMMRLRSRPFVMVSMIMQLLPCLDWCCIGTMPFAIWGLVVLSRPEVRKGFDAASRQRDRGQSRPPERDHRGYDDEDDDP